ncbi:MAG: 3-isopropylmalate dehydratase small subunit [Pseudomonadota bacterium]
MAGWRKHSGPALALMVDHIDTDQLIPARFMSVPRSAGYGPYLLYDMRRDRADQLLTDFPLNRHPEASILVSGAHFGSGSSREAAVYALLDAGIRAVIAPDFGDIFATNAVNNGLLPAQVSAETTQTLARALGTGTSPLSVDLDSATLTLGELTVSFDLDDSWRIKLINGWDDIDITQQHRDAISAYRETRNQTAPWAWPKAAD